MAGHRRVSGRPICPEDGNMSDNNMDNSMPSSRRSVRPSPPPQVQQTVRPPPSKRPAPGDQEPRPRPRVTKRERTASPAPTVTGEEYHKTQDESYYTENDPVESPAPPKQRTPSKIGPTSSFRTIAQRLGVPLASIFTAPKSDIEKVQQEAGKHGLYTGTVYKPRRITEEESQRWVVMGRDPETVDQLVDYQKKDVARQLGLEVESPTTTSVPAPTPPVTVTCNGPSIWKIIAAFVFAAPFLAWATLCMIASL
jgi:hypothetical protein